MNDEPKPFAFAEQPGAPAPPQATLLQEKLPARPGRKKNPALPGRKKNPALARAPRAPKAAKKLRQAKRKLAPTSEPAQQPVGKLDMQGLLVGLGAFTPAEAAAVMKLAATLQPFDAATRVRIFAALPYVMSA